MQHFVELTTALDEAVESQQDDRIHDSRAALQVFYGSLSVAEQQDIQKYVQNVIIGQAIEDGRGIIWKGVARVMHWPGRIVGTAAEPLAKLSEETIHFVLLTIGHSIGGVIRGTRGAWDVIRRAAA
ncbi:MAG: hypothetical protein WCX61_01285 [Candidatus Peribacteraceae bacterium]